VHGPRTIKATAITFAATALAVVSLAHAALAQAPPEVTPNFSVTPSKTVAPWIYQMAIGAVVVAVLILIFILASYLRFSPKFFGREQPQRVLPPGARPPLLQRAPRARQVAATTPPRPASGPPAPSVAAPAAASSTAGATTAVAERPAPRPTPAVSEGTAAAAAASAAPTAPPASEPAVQADAAGQAEAAAPEPTAPPAAEAEPAEAEAPPPAAPSPAPQPAAASHAEAALDQETFDRVLKEQLDKGMDRRVAEGRARAAAVVAARKKAQR
jgi:hypothetical protein